MDLAGLVQLQAMHPVWGNFAQTLVRLEETAHFCSRKAYRRPLADQPQNDTASK
jgi:hypothetical protein